jgi:hypothetical protein
MPTDSIDTLRVSIYLSVTDEVAFRRSAYGQALADGLDSATASAYLDAAATSLTAAAVMVFDPGVSPPGCEIRESVAE